MTPPDDQDPHLTRALGLWADAAPALPDDFTATLMAEVAVQRVGAAWAEAAVPALPDDFAAMVAAKAAARPKLHVVDGGEATREATPAKVRSARAWWQWPAVAVAAAAMLALLSSRATPTVDHPATVAQRGDAEAPRVAPAAVNPVAVAMAEVTRVEVLGAQSVAVLSIGSEGGESGSPVVWITDKTEDAPGGDLETRMQ